MPTLTGNSTTTPRLLTLIATILVIAMLYLGREVLIPIALAILLCFLLAPLANRLQRVGLGRVPSALAVVALATLLVGLLGFVVTMEGLNLAESLPQYRANIREKMQAIARPGALSRAKHGIQQVTEDAIRAATQTDAAATRPASRPTVAVQAGSLSPLPAPTVRVIEPEPTAFQSLTLALRPLLRPLASAAIVVVFVIFILIRREDLRDRMIRLVGLSQIHLTMQAIDDAAKRVSRYLLRQFVVNLTYGAACTLGLQLIGVPNAVLWGVMCATLRYIPYIGAWVGAAMPAVLSLAVFDDWLRPTIVISMFVALEVIVSNFIEPLVYGAGAGVSPLAVLVSAVFWGWLWGIPGLVLATPMTVCAVVLGRYVPQMAWLSVLLGDEPGLPLPERVYQRLLAADQEEVFDLAAEYLKSNTLLEWYDNVLAPALSLAERDRHNGLDLPRTQVVYDGVRNLIEELDEHTSAAPEDQTPGTAAPPRAPAPPASGMPLILIVAAHDQADELAALMLAQVLGREGRRCELLPLGTLTAEMQDRAASLSPGVMCISSMPPMAISHARYVCKRLHARLPETPVLVGLWRASDPQRVAPRVKTCGAETVVATLTDAVAQLRV